MLLDALDELFSAQALAASGNSNVRDCLASRNLGSGKQMHAYVSFDGIAPTGTAPTLSLALVGADDAAISVNKITIATITPALTTGVVPPGNFEVPIPSHVPKRYFRMEATLGGTTPTMTLTAGFAEDYQSTPAPLNS